jgi:hypothetical protein
MSQHSRREFMSDVGRGMFIAGLGSGLAADLGLSSARAAEEETRRLTFGNLEPLVGLMQDTPAAQLLPILVRKIEDGTSLKDLVAAATFANARTFGGEDYIGFHTLMALAPAYNMSKELPKERQALPVLKVLYRNTSRMQEKGGSKQEVLQSPPAPAKGSDVPLIDHVHRKDMSAAEAAFAARIAKSTDEGFNYLLEAVQDHPEVHRVVLPYRAYALLEIVGKEHAQTMLRQSVHYLVKNDNPKYDVAHYDGLRKALPKLLDQYKLANGSKAKREADEAWIDKLSDAIFVGSPDAAAEAAAAALAEGFAASAVADAIALAANQLVLRDAGRPQNQTSPGKPVGSVHGDSIGVHACDSANAWRNLARLGNPRNQAACTIIGAWQVARDRGERGGDFLNWKPRPWTDHLDGVKAKEPKTLIAELEDAIKHNDQARACAVTAKCAEAGLEARGVLDLLLKYAISEEGALHAEKYYQTCTEEFKLARPKFRWRQVVALARVTASEYGIPAAGYAESCKLLKI